MLRLSRTLLAVLALTLPNMGCSGNDGADGAQGTKGADGTDGTDGQQGVKGADGTDGSQGNTGETGKTGETGEDGSEGAEGQMGSEGQTSLTVQMALGAGDSACFNGGVRFDTGLDTDGDGELDADEVTQTSSLCAATVPNRDKNFNRIASFPVCSQIDDTCDDDTETAAEIVTASTDGMTLIYSDSPNEVIGFVDITDPSNPVADGTVSVAGEPTSVSVAGDYVLVGVNTSPDFDNPSGELDIVAIASQTSVRTIDLGGQPDSIAVSPDGAYAAVVIENERDEDENDGALPQLPAGKLVIIGLSGAPSAWTATDVDLTGLDGVAEPTDPEPEFVDINADNIAVVTLQENNAIALVDLATASVTTSFSAGTVNLTQVDATEEDALISQTESLNDIPREPDGVSWLSTEYFATADEGDLYGGSRGFTIFDTAGNVVWSSGNEIEHLTARLGHYPDGRSENKGSEPENAEFGVFGNERYLFINSERSSLVLVYDVADLTKPVFKQALPTALGPEGALAIPSRNLLVVASEEDSRGDALRSAVNIYAYNTAPAQYPTLVSADRLDGTPIPWGAMSGLAADPGNANVLYSIEDSFYLSNRIFKIDVSTMPARIVQEIRMRDSNDVFASVPAESLVDDTVDPEDDTRKALFDEADLAAMINDDKTINIDPEGIAVSAAGGFWVASEGAGTVAEADARPINSLNFLFKLDAFGVIEDVVTLPSTLNDNQLRFGFEGVTEYNGKLYVAFQRVWQGAGDSDVRIGIYDIAGESWEFVFYKLDAPESQNGGWVGLSDLTSLGGGQFLVVERDNQSGPDAAIKRLYRIDLSGLNDGDTVELGDKELVRDLMPDLLTPGGLVVEKIEGATISASGDVWVVNDNDGVDDNSGETLLLKLGRVL